MRISLWWSVANINYYNMLENLLKALDGHWYIVKDRCQGYTGSYIKSYSFPKFKM